MLKRRRLAVYISPVAAVQHVLYEELQMPTDVDGGGETFARQVGAKPLA
ncbi:MAG: hypothetical protein JOY64_09890 [Alphaproteobacteria bacterium]|nr:hypothetical protein [Alphaproteobacteria bacterium]